MLWHIPFLHAVAEKTPSKKITLLTKKQSKADEFLLADPLVEDILWVDSCKTLLSLARTLRPYHFQSVWILHQSWRYAAASLLAHIPNRYGYGIGLQKYFLNQKPLLSAAFHHENPAEKAREFFKARGQDIPPSPPFLSGEAEDFISSKFSHFPKPWVILGIGASEENKKWPLDRYRDLVKKLSDKMPGTFFVCGGPLDKEAATYVAKECLQAVSVTDLNLMYMFTLISKASFYIGNDTSLLNVSCSFGILSLGLFGPTPPLTFYPSLLPFSKNTMEQISVDDIFDFALPHMSFTLP